MSFVVMCAYETLAATVHRAHSSPRETLIMPTAPDVRSRPGAGHAQNTGFDRRRCTRVGTAARHVWPNHEEIYQVTWLNMEFARLLDALLDSSVRDAFTVICEGHTRDRMDANVPDSWLIIASSTTCLSSPTRIGTRTLPHVDLDVGEPTIPCNI